MTIFFFVVSHFYSILLHKLCSKKETETVPEEWQLLHPDARGTSVYLDTWLNLYKSLKMNKERNVPPSHQSAVVSFKEISLDAPTTRSVWTVIVVTGLCCRSLTNVCTFLFPNQWFSILDPLDMCSLGTTNQNAKFFNRILCNLFRMYNQVLESVWWYCFLVYFVYGIRTVKTLQAT